MDYNQILLNYFKVNKFPKINKPDFKKDIKLQTVIVDNFEEKLIKNYEFKKADIKIKVNSFVSTNVLDYISYLTIEDIKRQDKLIHKYNMKKTDFYNLLKGEYEFDEVFKAIKNDRVFIKCRLEKNVLIFRLGKYVNTKYGIRTFSPVFIRKVLKNG